MIMGSGKPFARLLTQSALKVDAKPTQAGVTVFAKKAAPHGRPAGAKGSPAGAIYGILNSNGKPGNPDKPKPGKEPHHV